MKSIRLVAAAALFALTLPAVAIAAEAMPTAPAVSENPMEEQRGGDMGMKMEGDEKKMEKQKDGMGMKMENTKMDEEKMKAEKK